jgi:hypothetical protein
VEQENHRKELITLITLMGLERGASASELGKNRRSPNWHGTAQRGYFGFRILDFLLWRVRENAGGQADADQENH